MPQSTIEFLLQIIWIPLVTGLALLWSKMTGVDLRTAVLEQSDSHYRTQREEDRQLRDKQREEILSKIDHQHKTLTHQHESLMRKLDQVDTRVKNGH